MKLSKNNCEKNTFDSEDHHHILDDYNSDDDEDDQNERCKDHEMVMRMFFIASLLFGQIVYFLKLDRHSSSR